MKTLLKQLVAAAPTLENGELQAAGVLKQYFTRHGLDAEVDVWDITRANVIVHAKAPGDAARPPLLIAAHLDVVPAAGDKWSTPPFEAVEKDGCIYGRGTTDMLGAVAAVSAALAETAGPNNRLTRDVVFAVTAGEETDSCGTKRFVPQYKDRFADPEGILIPEPTDLEILRAHRGILWLQIAAHGRTAHGSMPHLGINAILKINTVLNHLKDMTVAHTPHPLLGGCSMSVNRIHGGSGTNIVPESCAIEIDIRTLPGQLPEDIIAQFQALLDRLEKEDTEFKAEISVLRNAGAIETPEDHPFVRSICRTLGTDKTGAVGFTTDGPYFAPLGAVLIAGPGKPDRCHKPDECIEIEALEQGKAMYQRILTS